jgi:drug/metabolite transporter (DMT)-like permease
MLYLVLAILFSSLFPITIRISNHYKTNSNAMIVFNYFFGAIISLVLFILNLPNPLDKQEILKALIIGIPTGIIYYFGLLLYQLAIKQNGVSIAALFMKISLVIPIILSIIIFLERPLLNQYIGILLAIVAIIYLNGGIKQIKGVTPLLLLLFICAGLGDFFNKVFQDLGSEQYSHLFIFFNFITAASFGFFKNIKGVMDHIDLKHSTFGIIIGLVNALTTQFIVLTFTRIPASIALVILNVSVIVIVSLIGVLFFKEKLSKKHVLSFILIIISLVLISYN